MRDLTDVEIDTYRRDGVVCLRQVLAPERVAVVSAAVEQVQADYEEPKAQGAERDGVMDIVLGRSHLRALSVLGEAAEDAGWPWRALCPLSPVSCSTPTRSTSSSTRSSSRNPVR